MSDTSDFQDRHDAIDALQGSLLTPTIERPQTDQWTRAGHERFKKTIRFNVEISPDQKPVVMTWDEWMEWQATRDPMLDNPTEADRIRKNMELQIQAERRGPGIARRPVKKAVKKAAPHKPTNAKDN